MDYVVHYFAHTSKETIELYNVYIRNKFIEKNMTINIKYIDVV